MAKLRDDIANTERLIDDAARALKEKEADRSGLVEMQEALNAKLQSCQCERVRVRSTCDPREVLECAIVSRLSSSSMSCRPR